MHACSPRFWRRVHRPIRDVFSVLSDCDTVEEPGGPHLLRNSARWSLTCRSPAVRDTRSDLSASLFDEEEPEPSCFLRLGKKMPGVVKHGNLVMDGCSFVSPPVAAAAGEFNLQSADILIAMTGYIGDVAIVRSSDLPAVLNQRVGLFSIRDPSLLENQFLFYLLQHEAIRKQVRELGYGSAQPNVSPSLVHSINIPFPSLPEQRAIAHILGTLDDKIELNRRMNETLEAMARALFKSWFVDFDPMRAKMVGQDTGLTADTADLFGGSFVDSEIGTIPEGWLVGSLADVAASPRRIAHPADFDHKTPYIGLEHMPRRSIALSAWGTAREVVSSKSQFEHGDVLYGKLRPYFHKIGVAPVTGVCSTDIVVIAPQGPNWSTFVTNVVSSDEFVAYTDRTSTGTKMPRTSWKTMRQYPLCIPPEPIVRAYQEIAGPMLNMIVANIHANNGLALLRDTLLPKLISGELRLLQAEQSIAAEL